MDLFDLYASLTLDTSDYKSGISTASSLTSSLSAATVAFGQLAASAVQKVTSAFTDLCESIVETGSETEVSFAQLETIAGSENIDALTESLTELSTQTGISSSELAETAYNAISAGASAEEAAGMVEAAAKLATAGFTDTDSALSVLSTTINAYGLETEDATAISDSLIQVQNLGVTTIDELASSMGKAISTASAYNVDLYNLESAYVSLTKAGISTEESTTYLSSMLNELGDSSSDVATIISEETGMSFGELMDSGASLADVMQILYDYCEGDSEALMNLWSSAEAGKASNAIVSQGLEEFNENLESISTSSGTTEEAYSIMADTLSYKTGVMKTSFENLGLAIYDKVSPYLSDLVDFITDTVIPKIDAFVDSIDFEALIGGAVSFIQDKVIPVLKTFADFFTETIVPALSTLKSHITDEIIPTLEDFAEKIDFEAILDGLSSFLEGTVFPVLEGLYQNLDVIIPIVAGLVAGITTFKTVMNISSLISGVSNAITAFKSVNEAASVAQALLNTVMNANPFAIVAAVVVALVAVIVTLWTTNEDFRNAVLNIWAQIQNAFTAAWEAVQAAWEGAAAFFQSIYEGITGAFAAVTEWFANIFTSAWTAVKNAWSSVTSWFANIWSGIKNAFSSTASWFSNTFTSAWNGIKSAWSSVTSWFSNIWTGIKNVFSSVSTWFKTAFSNAVSGIKTSWSSVTSYFSNVWTNIKNVFSGAYSTFQSIGKNVINGIISGITGMVSSLYQSIENALSGLVTKAKKALGISSPSKVFASIGGYMAEGLDEGWSDEMDAVKDHVADDLDFDVGTVAIQAAVTEGFGTEQVDDLEAVSVSLDSRFDQLLAVMEEYFPQFANISLYLDGDTLVSETAGRMDQALSGLSAREVRLA